MPIVCIYVHVGNRWISILSQRKVEWKKNHLKSKEKTKFCAHENVLCLCLYVEYYVFMLRYFVPYHLRFVLKTLGQIGVDELALWIRYNQVEISLIKGELCSNFFSCIPDGILCNE